MEFSKSYLKRVTMGELLNVGPVMRIVPVSGPEAPVVMVFYARRLRNVMTAIPIHVDLAMRIAQEPEPERLVETVRDARSLKIAMMVIPMHAPVVADPYFPLPRLNGPDSLAYCINMVDQMKAGTR